MNPACNNPYAVMRPEFTLRSSASATAGLRLQVVRDGDTPIAEMLPPHESESSPFRAECDARMLAFSGKLHWALGNTCAGLLSIAQDLRVVAQFAGADLDKLREQITKIAAQAVAMSRREHGAYEGALLTGEEAKAFDARFKQELTGLPSEAETAAILAEFSQWTARSGNAAELPNAQTSTASKAR